MVDPHMPLLAEVRAIRARFGADDLNERRALRYPLTRSPAQEHDLRSGIRDGLPPQARPMAEDRHLVLRSARAVAARLQREHQRPAAPVHAQGDRPHPRQTNLAQ